MAESTSGTEAAARVADVLLLFTDGPSTLGVSHIARELGLSKAVVHRILQSLTARGMVTLDRETRQYRLGPSATALGARAFRDSDLRFSAVELLRELRDKTGETATLTQLVPNGRVYIDQVESTHEIKMTVELGRRFPLHAGGTGKCMLAYLPEATRERMLGRKLPALTGDTVTDPETLRAELDQARDLGYASSGGERQSDAGSVAAPIFGATGDVIGAISVCGPRYRITPEFVAEVAPLVVDVAARITRRVGHPG